MALVDSNEWRRLVELYGEIGAIATSVSCSQMIPIGAAAWRLPPPTSISTSPNTG